MTLNNNQSARIVVPTEEDVQLAQESSQILASCTKGNVKYRTIKIVQDNATSEDINIPLQAFNLLIDILAQIAQGKSVTTIPVQAELTIQEAADVLNVSCSYLVGLLESREIPHTKVGTEQKVRYQDVIKYKNQIDTLRMQTLDALTAQAQELDMGYE